MSCSVVWLKRDLRVRDHEPLCRAIAAGDPVAIVYCFEPALLEDSHYSPRHWRFVWQSLDALDAKLAPVGGTVLRFHADSLIGMAGTVSGIGLWRRSYRIPRWTNCAIARSNRVAEPQHSL